MPTLSTGVVFSRLKRLVEFRRKQGNRATLILISRKFGIAGLENFRYLEIKRWRDLGLFWRKEGSRATLYLIGRKLGLGVAPPYHPGPPLEPPHSPQATLSYAEYDVVFFIGCWEGESKRYRVYNVATALEIAGFRVRVHPEATCYDLVNEGWKTRCAVFFRTPYQERFRIDQVIGQVRKFGGKVIFDIDDLVFDPSLISNIHGFTLLSPKQQEEYIEGVHRYRQLLRLCDFATVSTKPLARAVAKLGVPAFVVPNSLNGLQMDFAKQLLGIVASENAGRLRIGYFSGSRTHERDFKQAEASLLRLLRTRTDIELLIVGFLELGPEWAGMTNRIIRKSFVPPLEMLELLSGCDINIAPLEIGDPFCEAKSELKFFEAALVETVTVASATEPFCEAIEPGVTGYLASTSEQWFDALNTLINDEDLRRAMGRRARASAILQFGVEATSRVAQAVLLGVDNHDVPPHTVYPSPHSHLLKIDWIVPRLIVGGGGHRNILRAAHYLQTVGHNVALHFTNSDDQAGELSEIVRNNFYPFEGLIKVYDGSFRNTDVLFATHWTTVDAALRAAENSKEIMYFVQDFEPAFAPMGSEYILAENTYRMGLYCITSGPWCEKLLKRDYSCEADYFLFPLNRDVYRTRARTKHNANIVFFAKPEMPRRCFEIGALALAQFHRLRPDVEIILFGSGAIDRRSLDFRATVRDVVPTIEDLSIMYANADIGIAFSTTNPSLIPFEMMACGCPVVDLDRPGNEWNYAGRRDLAFLADPMPMSMGRQIADLLDRKDELIARRDRSLAFAATFPTEVEMAKRIEDLILARMRAKGRR